MELQKRPEKQKARAVTSWPAHIQRNTNKITWTKNHPFQDPDHLYVIYDDIYINNQGEIAEAFCDLFASALVNDNNPNTPTVILPDYDVTLNDSISSKEIKPPVDRNRNWLPIWTLPTNSGRLLACWGRYPNFMLNNFSLCIQRRAFPSKWKTR